MRACSKYLVEDLKKEVKAHLMILFPSTLKGYRSSTRLEGVASDFNGILGIVVGEECLPDILPVAYYECAITPIENTLDGVDIGGQRVTLSPEAQRTALLFRQRFRDFVSSSANLAQMFSEERAQWDRTRDECQEEGLDCALALEASYYRSPDSNVIMNLAMDDQCFTQGWELCESCKTMLEEIEREFQDDVWRMLPTWCGLEG